MATIILPADCQLKNLNSHLAINPQKQAQRLGREALAWKTLAVISAVAFTAIMGTALAFSFGLITIPVGIFAPVVLTTIPLNWGIGKCFIRHRQASECAKTERGVAEQLRNIENWDIEKVEKFLKNHGIESNENRGLLSELLPGIARYEYYNNLGNTTFAQAKADLALEIEDKQTEDVCHLHALQMLELKAFPSFIKAARMLEILKQPYSDVNLDENRLTLKSFEQRMLHRHYNLNKNDDYVRLPNGSITFEEIYTSPDAIDLRGRLFPLN